MTLNQHFIAQAKEAKMALISLNERIQHAIEYFSSSKFNWPNDYVRTWETLGYLRAWQVDIQNTLGNLTVRVREAETSNQEMPWKLDGGAIVRGQHETAPTDPGYEHSKISQLEKASFEEQFTEWKGNSDGSVGCD